MDGSRTVSSYSHASRAGVAPWTIGAYIVPIDLIYDGEVLEAMRERGIDPESDEAQLFGRRMLRALTDAFGRTILGTGFFHADP